MERGGDLLSERVYRAEAPAAGEDPAASVGGPSAPRSTASTANSSATWAPQPGGEMSTANVTAPRRRQLLAAMGITLYRRRAAIRAAAGRDCCRGSGRAAGAGRAEEGSPPQLVVVGRSADRARLALLQRLLGSHVALQWLDASAAGLAQAPAAAPAYLVLGPALARPLGAQLPTTTQQAAQIVVTTAPVEWRDGAAKRALWQS